MEACKWCGSLGLHEENRPPHDVSLDYLVGRCQNSKAHKTRKEFKYKED